MFNGYLNFGGVEILNQARTFENRKSSDCPLGWLRCMPCPGLEDALGHSYENNIEDSPWYDEEDEPTHRFYGLYPIDMIGLDDSTRTAEIEERIADGAVVNGKRRASREIRVTGLMIGQGQDALESGMSWLDSALEGDQCSTHEGACGQVDACFLSTCPPERGTTKGHTPWTIMRTNFATNPSFETASGTVVVKENLATNPSFETTSGTVAIATNLATNPSFETTSGTVEVRRNLHPNPSVEAAVVSNNWHVGNNGTGSTSTGTRVAAIGYDGGYGWRKEWTAADTSANVSPTINMLGTSSGDALAASPSTAYTASVWVRPSLAETMSMTFVEHDAAGAVSVAGGTRVNVAAGEWARLSVTVTTKSTTVKIRFSIATHSSIIRAVGTQWDADMFLLEQSSTLGPYFDGSTRPAIRENLLANPNFETNITGWAGAGTPAGILTRVTTEKHSGTASLQVVTAGDTTAAGAFTTNRVSIAGGDTVTASWWIKGTAGAKMKNELRWIDAAGAIVGTAVISTLTLAGGWERFSLTGTAPATATQSDLVIRANELVARTFFLDDVLYEKSSTMGDYFDGSTPAVGNIAYAWRGTANGTASYSYDTDLSPSWTGTANASASVLTGRAVTQYTRQGVNSRAFQSSAWASTRANSLRIIATSPANNDTYAEIIGVELGVLLPGKTYTMQAKVHLDAPLTGALVAYSRGFRMSWATPAGAYHLVSPLAPNTAGTHLVTLTFTVPADATAINFMRLYNGAFKGGGDVWWDDLAIVEGTYTGPYFDGYSTGAIRENQVTNPNFGQGSLAGWASYWAPTRALTTANPYPGGNGTSMLVSKNTDTNTAQGTNTFLTKGWFKAGDTLRILLRIRGEVGVVMAIGVRVDAGSAQGYSVTGDGAWHEYEITKVATAAMESAGVGVQVNATNSNTWPINSPMFQIDSVLLANETTGAYFDGDTPTKGNIDYVWRGAAGSTTSYSRDADLTYGWTGTADASTSTLTGVGVPTTSSSNSSARVISSTAWHRSRTKSLRILTTPYPADPTNNFAYIGGGNAMTSLGLVAGKTYTVLATAHLAAPLTGTMNSNSRRILITGDATAGSVAPPNAAGDYPQSVTFTLPADATTVAIRLYKGSTDPVNDVWWDDVAVVEGTYTGPYFDGYSVGAIRENLINNPSPTVNITGWSAIGGATIVRTTAEKNLNVASAQIVTPGTASAEGGVVSSGIVVLEGHTYSASIWVKAPAGARLYLGLRLYSTGAGEKTTLFTATGGWQQVKVEASVATAFTGGSFSASVHVRTQSGTPQALTFYIADAVLEEASTTGTYFDGSTATSGNIDYVWRGTANASASYSHDADLTYGWSGTPDASTSQVTGVGIATYNTPPTIAKGIQSTAWRLTGSKSLRQIPTYPTRGSAYTELANNASPRGLEPGKTYTVKATVRRAVAPVGLPAVNTGIYITGTTGGYNKQVYAPTDQAGVFPLELSITIPPTGPWYLRLINGGMMGDPDTWWDSLIIADGEYGGPYFDGATTDTTEARYSWFGAAHASISFYETRAETELPWTDEEYAAVTDPLWRRMHGVTCISGPLVTDRYHRGEFYAYGIEFTLLATSPHIYGAPTRIDPPSTGGVVMQDSPTNLVPYPSAKLIDAADLIVASNFSTNPSFEVNTDRWAAVADGTAITTAKVAAAISTDLHADRAQSYKVVFTSTAAGSNGWFGAQHEVTIPTTAKMRFSVSIWATGQLNTGAGTAVIGAPIVEALWRLAGATVRTDVLGTIGVNGGVVSSKSILPPTGATSVIIRVRQPVTSWTSGGGVRLYVDALAVTVP